MITIWWIVILCLLSPCFDNAMHGRYTLRKNSYQEYLSYIASSKQEDKRQRMTIHPRVWYIWSSDVRIRIRIWIQIQRFLGWIWIRDARIRTSLIQSLVRLKNPSAELSSIIFWKCDQSWYELYEVHDRPPSKLVIKHIFMESLLLLGGSLGNSIYFYVPASLIFSLFSCLSFHLRISPEEWYIFPLQL